MGKKYRNLYEQICSFENLWYAARKARRGKRFRDSVLEFEFDLERNLFEIQQLLRANNYQFSGYRFFTINDPQERCIAAAPYTDRVVHHAICNVIEPILDRAMIFDSYACRKGKGTHRAVARAQQFLRKNMWVLKLDIKKYFFTIDHKILKDDLSRKITDEQVINLFERLLESYHSRPEYIFEFDGTHSSESRQKLGVPIGNLTSQIFANYFLTPLDRYIKEKLKFKYYLRYMDDALVFANTKKELCTAKSHIEKFLCNRALKLHEQKSQVFPAIHGIRFLGFHVYPYQKKILRPNLKRFKKRMKEKSWLYHNGMIDFEHLMLSLNGWIGFAMKQENESLINQVLEHIKFQHPNKKAKFNFVV